MRNLKTHAYGHRALCDKVYLDAVLAEAPSADFVVRRAVHVDWIKRVDQQAEDNYASVFENVFKASSNTPSL